MSDIRDSGGGQGPSGHDQDEGSWFKQRRRGDNKQARSSQQQGGHRYCQSQVSPPLPPRGGADNSHAPWQSGIASTWRSQVDENRAKASICCVCAPIQTPRGSAYAFLRTARSSTWPRGTGKATPAIHRKARSPRWSPGGRRRHRLHGARRPGRQGRTQLRQ